MKNIFNQVDDSIYSNAMTFLRQPLDQNPTASSADIVVLGLPFDMVLERVDCTDSNSISDLDGFRGFKFTG